jgi:signal peptidase I
MDDVTKRDPDAGSEPDAVVATDDVGASDSTDSEIVDGTPKKKKQGSFLRELPFLLLIAFLLALLIKAFLVQAFFIPSESMENTLKVKDRVLVNKLVYRFRDIHRGEIVVFKGPEGWQSEVSIPPPANALDSFRRKVSSLLGLGHPGEKDFIKRVIGTPGDTVQCCDPQGRVIVNGQPLDEPYLFEDNKEAFGPITVPEGRLWVMGDHRGRSSDSRAHIGEGTAQGTVPIDNVIGRAFVIIWPVKNFEGLRVPHELESSKDALGPATWPLPLNPPLLGLAGSVPITLVRRRRRAQRLARP